MEVNQEKRAKFMENAGKRVNKVMHDIEILEPMSRSSVYDFTKEDVEEMFCAMQNALDTAKAEYNKKFEGRAKAERKLFSFGTGAAQTAPTENATSAINTGINANAINTNVAIEANNETTYEITNAQSIEETTDSIDVTEVFE